jgi:hypothetical protein
MDGAGVKLRRDGGLTMAGDGGLASVSVEPDSFGISEKFNNTR